ncbi:MAG: hypothetical protein V4625_02435 [Pseudomonadota bacterium]
MIVVTHVFLIVVLAWYRPAVASRVGAAMIGIKPLTDKANVERTRYG